MAHWLLHKEFSSIELALVVARTNLNNKTKIPQRNSHSIASTHSSKPRKITDTTSTVRYPTVSSAPVQSFSSNELLTHSIVLLTPRYKMAASISENDPARANTAIPIDTERCCVPRFDRCQDVSRIGMQNTHQPRALISPIEISVVAWLLR